jgi:hypothetical protein
MPRKQQKKIRHIGLRPDRNKYDPLERAFAEEWESENTGGYRSHTAYQRGILQALLNYSVRKNGEYVRSYGFNMSGIREKTAFQINQRDATIVATIIQWLGTNVGFCFLRKCLGKAGYEIREVPNRRELFPREWDVPQETVYVIPNRIELYKEIKKVGYHTWLYGYEIHHDQGCTYDGNKRIDYDYYFIGPRVYVKGTAVRLSNRTFSAAGLAKHITRLERAKKAPKRLPG